MTAARPGAGLDNELSRFLADGPPPIVFTLAPLPSTSRGAFSTRAPPRPNGLAAAPCFWWSSTPSRSPHLRCRSDRGLRVRALLRALPTRRGNRPPGWDWHHRPGAAIGAADAGNAQRLSPADNAALVVRLGVARTISRRHYRAERVTAELALVARGPPLRRAGAPTGRPGPAEDGVPPPAMLSKSNCRLSDYRRIRRTAGPNGAGPARRGIDSAYVEVAVGG